MLNVGVLLVMLMTLKLHLIFKLLLVFCMLCGLTAVALSQARGVWLVLPAYFLITVYYGLKYSKPKLLIALSIMSLLAGGALSVFQGEMVGKRINLAVDEVSSYYNDNKYKSSLGTRLAMWDIAVDVWLKNHVVGTGPGDFDSEVIARQEQGEFKGMQVFTSTRNIYFQALVNVGSIGLIVMLVALFYMPYKLMRKSQKNDLSRYILGLVFLALFATVGIGESWTLRLPMVSVFIITLFAIVSRSVNYNAEN